MLQSTSALSRPAEGDEARLRVLETAADDIDPGHGRRVGAMTCFLAKLACAELAPRTILLAGRLHDVGKAALPSSIWKARRALDDAERALVRQHPALGVDLLRALPLQISPEIYDAVLFHHEHFNGLGYPAGLAGFRIPLIARLMSIADVVDALLSPRPYKSGWPPLKVRIYLADQAGLMFDGNLVALALDNFARMREIRSNA